MSHCPSCNSKINIFNKLKVLTLDGKKWYQFSKSGTGEYKTFCRVCDIEISASNEASYIKVIFLLYMVSVNTVNGFLRFKNENDLLLYNVLIQTLLFGLISYFISKKITYEKV